MIKINRRRVLRGILDGGAVTVGLPLLNCFLNGNGDALADGQPMPVRFGTWFWGLGMNAAIFVPKKTGADYELQEESAAFKPIQQDMNLLTNFTAFHDANQNLCHFSGWVITRSGHAPKTREDRPGETFDITIANQIGRSTRFKSLTTTATGDARTTVSYENSHSPSTPEYSALGFYQKLFGPDFQDPNSRTFTPNPRAMVRKSVLSGVMDEVTRLRTKVGREDKARLEQYFSGLRDLERQFDQQLVRPRPIASCAVPKAVEHDLDPGREAMLLSKRHRLMTDILAMAVACDQTRVFNMTYTASGADTVEAGYDKPHHTSTHEERIDDHLGYQPHVSWFTKRAMEEWTYYIQAFSRVKEGDRTLLDNCFIMANSDHGYARIHSLDGMAMMTAGRAGGKVRNGLHVDGGGTSTARLGFTSLRLMGVNVDSFGSESNKTSAAIEQILA